MPLRFPALALVLVVALAGCDSNGSTSALRELDGTYTVAQLTFDPQAGGLADADVGARLDAQTSFDIFSGNNTVLFTISRSGSRSLATLDATATRSRATFTARAGSEDELAALLLPRTFSLTFDPAAPRTLTGEINLTNVDLEAFDPAQYAGLRAVAGTLRIRLDRRATS